MKIKHWLISLLLTTSLVHAANEPAAMPKGAELFDEIAKLDARLFWAAFEGCDAEALAPILAPDFRMVHDDGGLAVPSREAFIKGMTQQCASREAGGANEGYANRRLLTPGSRRVQALGDWGALEEGLHNFFERQADGTWKLTGGARYIHIWQWVDDHFVLSESISVDHAAAEKYPANSSAE